jgi:hypothetical protein
MVACAAVVGLIATMTPAHASTDVFHSSFKGQQALAEFFSVSGCIETDAFISASQGRTRTGPGSPTRETDVFVDIFQFDVCTSTFISDASGSAVVPNSAFTINKSLSSAQLSATVQVTDFVSSVSYFVDVNVTWTGTGTASTTKSHVQQKFGNFTFMENFHGTNRDAQATGTVTRGATTLFSGTADFAFMADANDAFLSISRQ